MGSLRKRYAEEVTSDKNTWAMRGCGRVKSGEELSGEEYARVKFYGEHALELFFFLIKNVFLIGG